MRDPAGHPPGSKDIAERLRRKPRHLQQQCRVELDIGLQRARRLGDPKHVERGLLHFLGEVEVVFGLWAVVLMVAITAYAGWDTATHYLNSSVNYTEPLFVVVISSERQKGIDMSVCYAGHTLPEVDAIALADRAIATLTSAGEPAPAG